MAYKRSKPEDEVAAAMARSLPQCPLAEGYPALWAFLSDLVWEDGSEREPGTILLCVGDGQVKAWLNDRSEKRSAWLSGPRLSDVLAAVDEALDTGSVQWRSSKEQGRRK